MVDVSHLSDLFNNVVSAVDKEIEDCFHLCEPATDDSYYLLFDTETNGLPNRNINPVVWPTMVELAWQTYSKNGILLKQFSFIIHPQGKRRDINTKFHGISWEEAKQDGKPLRFVMKQFLGDCKKSKRLVAHGLARFDLGVVEKAARDCKLNAAVLHEMQHIDTISPYGGDRWVSLDEWYKDLFKRARTGAHRAAIDTTDLAKCFFHQNE